MASDWIETLANGGEIHYIDKVLGRYRRHYFDQFITLAKYPDLINHIRKKRSKMY